MGSLIIKFLFFILGWISTFAEFLHAYAWKSKAHKWNRDKAWKAVRSWTLLNFYVYSYSVF